MGKSAGPRSEGGGRAKSLKLKYANAIYLLVSSKIEVMVRVSMLVYAVLSFFIDSLKLFDSGKMGENKGKLF